MWHKNSHRGPHKDDNSLSLFHCAAIIAGSSDPLSGNFCAVHVWADRLLARCLFSIFIVGPQGPHIAPEDNCTSSLICTLLSWSISQPSFSPFSFPFASSCYPLWHQHPFISFLRTSHFLHLVFFSTRLVSFSQFRKMLNHKMLMVDSCPVLSDFVELLLTFHG